MHRMTIEQADAANKMKLHTQVKGSGPTLCLLHGWGMNHAVWQSITDQLSQSLTVISFDLPGYGYSRKALPTPYDLTSVAQLVSDNIPDNAILMGWSLGGLIAQQIAISQSVKLSALITIGCSPKFLQEKEWYGLKASVLQGFQTLLTQDYQSTIKRFLAIQGMGSKTDRSDIKILQQSLVDYPTPNLEALEQGLKILKRADLRASMGQIDIPFLRLYGRLDSLVPEKAIAAIDPLTRSEKYIFQSASHAPFISHPAEFCSCLRRWLQPLL